MIGEATDVGPAGDSFTPSSPVSKLSCRSGVWIVDDSPLHAESSRQALAAHYEVDVFGSAAAMLEAWATGARPSLLLLDWYMPDISGVEVCRFIRGELNLAQLPILVLTGVATHADLLEAFEAGVNDVIRKPVSELELGARVGGLLRMASLHSSLKQAEQSLRIEASFRERFMGMLAHDLRQPLHTMALARSALAQEPLSPNGREVSEMQLRAITRMQRMVTELLDFTRNRPETGLPLQRRTTDFAELAQLSLAEMRPAFPQHVLELSVHGPCQGEWDPDRITQVLSNLIGNAIEHGAPGGNVQVRLTGNAEDVELRVSNRGPVLPRELLATLFEPFRRGTQRRRPNTGVGLGLHIVQQIVRAHGGSVSVQNEEDEMHFVVCLPRSAPPPGQRPADAANGDSDGGSVFPPPNLQ